jgi:diguanylate cyclase (GGDEF)-like protein
LDLFDPGTEKFVHFRNDPRDPRSMSDNRIQSLWEDHTGCLWIGTWSGGLNKYDPTTGAFSRYQHDPGDPSSISENQVEAVMEDDRGRIWAGTWRSGLNCLVPASASAGEKGKDGNPRNAGDRFLRYQSDLNNPDSLSGNSIVYFYMDRQKDLWIGHSENGLSRIDSSTKPFHVFQNNPANPNSLGFNSVGCFYEDNQGILWIGTRGGGLDRFDRRNNRYAHFRNDPADPSSLSDNDVLSIHEDPARPDQILWICTSQGLCRFDKSGKRFKTILFNPRIPKSIDNVVYMIQKGDGRFIWIGTANGLIHFDTATERFVRYAHDPTDPSSLSANDNETLRMDKSGNLWVGTFNTGLNLLRKGEKSFIRYLSDPRNPDSLSSDMINYIFEDRSGYIWIGTNRGLIFHDPKTGRFTLLSQRTGLPSTMIGAIQEDESGNLWIVTAKGLSRFNPADRSLKNFDVNDGLPSDELTLQSGYQSRSGELFFGTNKGFVAFHPGEIQDNPFLPTVVITDLKLFNESVPVGKRPDGRTILRKTITSTPALELTHRDYVVGLEFAALNFTLPEKNQYAYKMENFDKDWNYVGNRRFATYTSLPPGDYIFRVKASNNDGLWNEEGVSLRIRVIPPYWKTWWFETLLGLAALGIVGSFYKFRTRAIRRRNILLENEVHKRTQELKEMSLADPLTGLRNRRFLQEIVQPDISAFIKFKKFARESRDRRVTPDNQRAVYGIFMFDLDHFKTVNDIFGHEGGDSVLKKFAQILRSSVREDDPVIRYGGEEFLVILKKTQPEYLDIFAKRILDKIRGAEYEMADNVRLKKTCSLGYTMFPFYNDALDLFLFDQTVMIADQGLYYAKSHGRNSAVKVLPNEDAPTNPSEAMKAFISLDDALKKGIVSIHVIQE